MPCKNGLGGTLLISATRQVTCAAQKYTPRLIVYPEIKSYEFSNGKALQNNSSLLIFTHTIQTIGYVIIPKPHFSSREGINSRCRRFVLTCCFLRVGSICRCYDHINRSCSCRTRSIDHQRFRVTPLFIQ